MKGALVNDSVNESEKMARLAYEAHAVVGFESVRVPFDVNVESEALGCILDYHKGPGKKWAKEKYGERVALAGNVGVSKSGTPMLDGSPNDVMEEARKCLEIGMPGSGFLLSAGCEVHHNVPEENILALIEAAKMYGHY